MQNVSKLTAIIFIGDSGAYVKKNSKSRFWFWTLEPPCFCPQKFVSTSLWLLWMVANVWRGAHTQFHIQVCQKYEPLSSVICFRLYSFKKYIERTWIQEFSTIIFSVPVQAKRFVLSTVERSQYSKYFIFLDFIFSFNG